jgi:energy-coupling factor transporter ATP-binding protein EcfA2
MQLTILKIILWPKNTDLRPRIIPFEPGKINVISGESGSGKSTLTWIVDYCLGSDKCSIPVGLIRDLTGWFGLHLKLANTEMIIARRNPEDQQSTTDLYWNEGLKLEVPAIVQKNARVDDLKNRFNQIANLPSLDFSTDESVGYGGRPSSRDMAAFNFQPQHIVANPYTFFFKADTTEHREKLRIIFPLVLGSIDATTLAKQRELKDTEREYDKLRRELEARTTAARAWEAEVESYYLQAKGLGLLADSPSPGADWGLDKYLLELRRVPDSVRKMDLPDVQEGTNEAATGEFVRVAAEEDQLAQDTGSLKRRLDKIEQLSASLNDYGSSFTSQEDRLEGVGWLEEKLRDNHECPVCTAVHTNGNTRLAELQTLAREMKTLAVSVRQAPAKLDQEQANIRQELRDKETLLSRARQKRKFLEERTATFASQRQRVRQIYLFVGRVEQALENVMSSRNVDDLQDKAKALAERLARLRKELDGKSRQDRLNAAIDKVSARIADYAKRLRLEHATENVRLNTRELTLQFRSLSGRTDFLWEVGSGQNWVGYHVAGLLALHEHFSGLPQNPVPRFLMIDQPSQVYFPEAWPAMDQTPSGNKPSERSPDIEGVRRIFAALSEFMAVLKGQFQVIVTEHAGSITWQGIDNVHLVANWREGHDDFLIPAEWQEKRS